MTDEKIGSFVSAAGAAGEVGDVGRPGVPGWEQPCGPSNFLLFSLPRSRSSWLSTFLTTDRAMCLHDYSAYGASLPSDLFQYNFVGMASTGAAAEWQHWVNKYPHAPRVVIRRDVATCADSFAKVMGGEPGDYADLMELMAANLEQIAALPGTLAVNFADIDARAVEIYHHCLPGQYLDLRRMHELLQMQIEPVPEKMRAEAARLASICWKRYD